MIKLVIFDLWNTLVSPNNLKFTQRIAKVLDLDEDYVLDYIRSSSSRHTNIHYMTIVREIWKYRYKTTIPIPILKEIENEYKDFVDQTVLIENALECINELHANGIKTAIVSNATSVSIDIVKKFKLDKIINKIYLSCLTGYLKPDPRSFQIVLHDFNVSFDEVCVVGDKITTDILGAKILKMNVILFAPNLYINNDTLPVDMLAISNNLIDIPRYIIK